MPPYQTLLLIAFYVATNVRTFLPRQKVVSVSQAATVGKLLAPLRGSVVEEAWKISPAKSWMIGKTTTASRALKIEKETNSLVLGQFYTQRAGGPVFLKIALIGKCALLICGFDFFMALSLGLSEYFSSIMNCLNYIYAKGRRSDSHATDSANFAMRYFCRY